METEKNKALKMYELRATNPASKIKGGVFGSGRILLGRTESCDLIVSHESISAVHAVLEIFDDRAIIYDMNSTNGTYVNDDKVIVKEFFIGDFFRLADIEFEFGHYSPSASLPPVLDALEPAKGSASVKMPPLPPEMSKSSDKELPKSSPEEMIPSVVYPLEADPKAEFSEYIFEDKDELYPIFKYEASKQAVEVIILFNDQVFSVDYLPEGKKTYYISGILTKEDELEFPYLPKNQKLPFVDVNGGISVVHTIPGFDVFLLTDKKKDTSNQSSIELRGQDLLRLQKNHLQIFVRNVAAPPKVASAPILKRDPDFRKYLFLFLFFVAMISVGFNVIEVPEDEKKEELAPERLATILYKQPLTTSTKKAVEKTENKPKVAQKAPDKVSVEKKVPTEKQPDVKKPDVVETKNQTQKPDPGKKTATEKKIVKQGTEPVKTPTNKTAAPPAAKSPTTAAKSATANTKPAFSQVTANTAGHVEVYKTADFASSVSTIVAKGGSLSGVQTKTASGSSGSGDIIGAATGVSSGSGNIKTADMVTNQGSLVGAASGALGESKGAEGLSAKRAIYTAGIPAETVVLGSMDPDVIRRRLMEFLPQFRSCYQRELEARGTEVNGTIKLNFVIGSSGHVTKAGVDGSTPLPTDVRGCVINVLRGITFPEPLGGGVVEVNQPMNFQPKRI